MATRQEKAQEGEALAELMGNRNQAQFAREFQLPGGPSMLSQHISGHRPISMEAAQIYAVGLGVPVERFSPRLAAKIQSLRTTRTASAALPPAKTTLSASLDKIASAIAALSQSDREQLAKALAILAVAPDSAEAKARVLNTLGEPQDDNRPSIVTSVLSATDLVETPVKTTHRD